MILTDEQHQQIHFYLLVLFCFFLLPLPRLAVFALVALILNCLAGGYLWRRASHAFSFWPLLFSSFYLLHLIGFSYTENLAEGLLDLETKLSFLLLPPVLFAVPLNYSNGRAFLLRAFVAGVFLATIYAYTRAGILYWNTGLNGFYYKYLSGYLHAHPTYVAMYLNFALFLLLEELFRKQLHLSWKGKALRLLLMAHFFLFIFLLTARMQLLLLILLLSFSYIWYMARRKKLAFALLGLVAGLGIAFTLAWKIPTTQARIQKAYSQFNDPQASPNIRWPIWSLGGELVKAAPLSGHGIGDVQDNLEILYERENLTEALEGHYNAHNQYVQTSIALGLPGLLTLLANLLLPLALSLRQKKFIYAFFLSLLLLSMLTECILEVQMGILFFVFFHCFLALDLQAPKSAKL